MSHYIPLPERAVLRIGGEDREAFLQGLITQDITLASPRQAIFAALLSAQGKFQFDFFIVSDGEHYFLDTEKERLPALQRMLGLYKLRSRVTIEALPDARVGAVTGQPGIQKMALPERLGATRTATNAYGRMLIYSDPRHAAMGARIMADNGPALQDFLKQHGLPEGRFEEYEALRIREVIPDGSRDATIDRTILLENGYDVLNGISFTKGCYVGQEVTARSKHRAVLRKRLCRVTADAMLPSPGTPIMAGTKEIGELRSVAGDQALALVRFDMLQTAQTADQVPMADGIPLTVHTAWWHAEESDLSTAEQT